LLLEQIDERRRQPITRRSSTLGGSISSTDSLQLRQSRNIPAYVTAPLRLSQSGPDRPVHPMGRCRLGAAVDPAPVEALGARLAESG
jgi:hypothetical protein